jgi:hypothetical protein
MADFSVGQFFKLVIAVVPMIEDIGNLLAIRPRIYSTN